MKKKLIRSLCFIFMLLCVGCQKKDNNYTVKQDVLCESEMLSNENNNMNTYEFPNLYFNEVENVSFDTEIVVSDAVTRNGLYSTQALVQKKNSMVAYETLFNGIEVKNSTEIEGDYGKEIYYQGANGESLYMTEDTLFMARNIYQNIINAFCLEGKEYNADLYLTGEEFEFMSIEEAYQNILKIASKIGLNIEGKYTCFSLNYKTLKESEFAIGKDGEEDTSSYKEQWTEDDNGYYFTIHQVLQDCIVQYPNADVYQKICDANAPIQVIFTKNGIEMFESGKIFTFKQGNELILLTNFENIADSIATKYNMLLTDSTYKVIKAELFWRPVKTESEIYEMIPTWEITVVETSSDSVSYMYINAVTAEEMI